MWQMESTGVTVRLVTADDQFIQPTALLFVVGNNEWATNKKW